jgi:hypothetical protein
LFSASASQRDYSIYGRQCCVAGFRIRAVGERGLIDPGERSKQQFRVRPDSDSTGRFESEPEVALMAGYLSGSQQTLT